MHFGSTGAVGTRLVTVDGGKKNKKKKYGGLKRRRCRGGWNGKSLFVSGDQQEKREVRAGVRELESHPVDQALLDTVESGPQTAADQAQT